jgi:hypothetical protein
MTRLEIKRRCVQGATHREVFHLNVAIALHLDNKGRETLMAAAAWGAHSALLHQAHSQLTELKRELASELLFA